jgi:hypothetical protein
MDVGGSGAWSTQQTRERPRPMAMLGCMHAGVGREERLEVEGNTDRWGPLVSEPERKGGVRTVASARPRL